MQLKKVIDQRQTYIMRSSASLTTNPLNDNKKGGHIAYVYTYVYIYTYIIYANIYIYIYLYI